MYVDFDKMFRKYFGGGYFCKVQVKDEVAICLEVQYSLLISSPRVWGLRTRYHEVIPS